jgi:hypothetical protein
MLENATIQPDIKKTLPLPHSIYIEPTSRCNEFCQQCPHTLLSHEREYIPNTLLANFLSHLPSLIHLSRQNWLAESEIIGALTTAIATLRVVTCLYAARFQCAIVHLPSVEPFI